LAQAVACIVLSVPPRIVVADRDGDDIGCRDRRADRLIVGDLIEQII
jgi:hypothetical protein